MSDRGSVSVVIPVYNETANLPELLRRTVEACRGLDRPWELVLVDDGRIVLIDLPQAVDLVGNPQGFAYLRRDCENICTWFAAHGAPHADPVELTEFLLRSVPGLT